MNAAAASHPPGSGEPTARLHRRGLLVARRRRVVFVTWLLLVVAAPGFVPGFASSLSTGNGLRAAGTLPSRAPAVLSRDLPAAGGQQATLVLSSSTLTVADPGFQRVIAAAARAVLPLRLPVTPAAADRAPVRGRQLFDDMRSWTVPGKEVSLSGVRLVDIGAHPALPDLRKTGSRTAWQPLS